MVQLSYRTYNMLPPLEVILYRYFEVLLFRCIFIFVWHLFRW